MFEESIKENIENAISVTFGKIPKTGFAVEIPADPENGDFSTNIALVYAKQVGMNPREFAERVAGKLQESLHQDIERIEVAGPGFINFYLSKKALTRILEHIKTMGHRYGSNDMLAGKKIAVEYIDPNPFKVIHIGHLMQAAIGESLAQITEFSGAMVRRVNYQGDVGLHVAKAVWGMKVAKDAGELGVVRGKNILAKAEFLGKAYAYGTGLYEEDERVKAEIREINKKVFERSDQEINELYDEGRAWSLEYFETIYARLGVTFDHYFFESETSKKGRQLVEEGLAKGVFEKSEGAVVYRGDREGLHTRVFINSEGLPMYEAKELGLAFLKHEWWPFDYTYVVTGNDIVGYFRVVLAAMKKVLPDIAAKIVHVPHGLLRLASGKMSSRTGNVITAEELLTSVTEALVPKMKEGPLTKNEREHVIEEVAVGAIKYSILRQSAGNDIIFDFNTSLSFEGDSGPYIQYTHARTRSVLAKAAAARVNPSLEEPSTNTHHLERSLMQFPGAVAKANQDRNPHFIAEYLFDLAQTFNGFYASERIVDAGDEAPYRVTLTEAVATTLKNGLTLLGIPAPERM